MRVLSGLFLAYFDYFWAFFVFFIFKSYQIGCILFKLYKFGYVLLLIFLVLSIVSFRRRSWENGLTFWENDHDLILYTDRPEFGFSWRDVDHVLFTLSDILVWSFFIFLLGCFYLSVYLPYTFPPTSRRYWLEEVQYEFGSWIISNFF